MNSDQLEYEEVDYLLSLLDEHLESLMCSYDLQLSGFPSEGLSNAYDRSRQLQLKLDVWRSNLRQAQ